MAEILPDDIKRDLLKAYRLHDRAVADYASCCEFSKAMSELLSRLEDAGYFRTADRVMGVLLDCNPKIGARCDKSSLVGQVMKKII